MYEVIARSQVTGESYGTIFYGEYEECVEFVEDYEPEGNEYVDIQQTRY